MTTIRQTLVYYDQFRKQILADIEGYSSGTRFTAEIVYGARKDTTADTVAELKRRLAFVENLIVKYNEDLNASGS